LRSRTPCHGTQQSPTRRYSSGMLCIDTFLLMALLIQYVLERYVHHLPRALRSQQTSRAPSILVSTLKCVAQSRHSAFCKTRVLSKHEATLVLSLVSCLHRELTGERTQSPTVTASRREPKHPSQYQLLKSQTSASTLQMPCPIQPEFASSQQPTLEPADAQRLRGCLDCFVHFKLYMH